jgi:gamma-glutamyltranspeptidase/glutathione hydrolase
MAAGFQLNNVQINFSTVKSDQSPPPANRMEANKRPDTSMAPTLVFDPQGKLKLVVGAAGASNIVDYVAQVIAGVIARGIELQHAVAQPHYGSEAQEPLLEAGTPVAQLAPALQAMGHTLQVKTMRTGLTAIVLTPTGLQGVADPCRDGIALGN